VKKVVGGLEAEFDIESIGGTEVESLDTQATIKTPGVDLNSVSFPQNRVNVENADIELTVENLEETKKLLDVTYSYGPADRVEPNGWHQQTEDIRLPPGEKEVRHSLNLEKLDIEEGKSRVDVEVDLNAHDSTYSREGTIEVEKQKNQESGGQRENPEITLEEGWNLVSVPEQTSTRGPSIQGFYLSELEQACNLETYEGEKTWMYSGSWEHPTAVSSHQGVLVKAGESCTTDIDSWPASGSPVDRPRKLEGGWNMISVPEPMSLNEYKGDCELVSREGAPLHALYGDSFSKLGFSHQMRPGEGYYVYAQGECKIGEQADEKPPIPGGEQR
jgi:hypothetical protein